MDEHDSEPLWKQLLFRALPHSVFWGVITGLLMLVVSEGIAPALGAACTAAGIVAISWWWLEGPAR
jgi:hypothetical protein